MINPRLSDRQEPVQARHNPAPPPVTLPAALGSAVPCPRGPRHRPLRPPLGGVPWGQGLSEVSPSGWNPGTLALLLTDASSKMGLPRHTRHPSLSLLPLLLTPRRFCLSCPLSDFLLNTCSFHTHTGRRLLLPQSHPKTACWQVRPRGGYHAASLRAGTLGAFVFKKLLLDSRTVPFSETFPLWFVLCNRPCASFRPPAALEVQRYCPPSFAGAAGKAPTRRAESPPDSSGSANHARFPGHEDGWAPCLCDS